MKPGSKKLGRCLWALLLLLPAGRPWANAPVDAGASLMQEYRSLRPTLMHSEFGLPLSLRTRIADQQAQGEAFVLMDTPLATLSDLFGQASNWCELGILHVNIKSCTYRDAGIRYFVGRKEYQEPEDAFALDYRFKVLQRNPESLRVRLDADEGPLGTSNYLLAVDAIAVDAGRSFLRFRYQYQFGWAARLAMGAYLATAGSDKVGFTVTGHDESGRAVYVRGMQGVVERNVMRYVLAIRSMLEESRPAARLERWYSLSEDYARQLVELKREQYLANKMLEQRNQLELQRALQARLDH